MITGIGITVAGKCGHGRNADTRFIYKPSIPGTGSEERNADNVCIDSGRRWAAGHRLCGPVAIRFIAKNDAVAIGGLIIPVYSARKIGAFVGRIAWLARSIQLGAAKE